MNYLELRIIDNIRMNINNIRGRDLGWGRKKYYNHNALTLARGLIIIFCIILLYVYEYFATDKTPCKIVTSKCQNVYSRVMKFLALSILILIIYAVN